MAYRIFGLGALAALIGLPTLLLCGCSTTNGMPPEEREQVIQQLQDARQTDLKNARDTALGPLAAEDYMSQASKADHVIDDLSNNNFVSHGEINDALWVPPKEITPEMRAQLIQQLEHAKALDDERYIDNLGGWNPALTEDFTIQSKRAKRVMRKLETEQPVSWAEIHQALYVPDEYY